MKLGGRFYTAALLGQAVFGGFGFGAALGGELSWWRVVLANAVAALTIGTYLLLAHPRLLREVREHGDPEIDEG